MAAVPHLRSSFLVLLFFSLFHSSSSLSQSEALLTLKKSLKNPPKLASWDPKFPPCVQNKRSSWIGVVCFDGSVTGIHISHMGLSGAIDFDALTSLPTLRTISLIDNKFDGDIPEFHRLGALKALFLTANRFSGEIPDDFFLKMTSLKKVWLAGNEFTGPIPTSLTRLPHLKELHLEDNHFSGTIPTFNAPLLQSFDVSKNRLLGRIPESLSKFERKSFEGNPGLCGEQVDKECPAAMAASAVAVPDSPEDSQGSGRLKLIVTILILMLGLLGIMVVVALKKRENDFDMLGRDMEEDAVMVHMESNRKESVRKESERSSRKAAGGVPDLVIVNNERGVFGLTDLMKAEAEVLGTGGLGSAYKAVMANGVAVVVKRMREMNRVGNDGFDTEMRRLGGLRHPNLLTPLAFHFRKEEKLLVHEFVPKGSLLYLLHGDRGPCHAELDWPTRLKIVRGVARGMAFLHSELTNSDLPHGNLKSSNILLAPDFEPLLADFGFFPLVLPTEASNTMFAYKTPESVQYRHVSPKSDVYCIGIVILEILTGKFPSQYLNNGKGGTDVVQLVSSALAEKRVAQVLDPEISGSSCSDDARAAMERLLHIGVECAEPNVESRPDMKEAAQKIEEVASVNGSKCSDGGGEQVVSPAPPPTHEANVREGFGELSGQRSGREILGDHPSLRRNGESYAFDIS